MKVKEIHAQRAMFTMMRHTITMMVISGLRGRGPCLGPRRNVESVGMRMDLDERIQPLNSELQTNEGAYGNMFLESFEEESE